MPPQDHPGLSAVRRMLTDVEFPTTKQRLLERAGDWEVTFPGNRDHRIRDLVARVPKYKFERPDEVVEELRRGWWFLAPPDERALDPDLRSDL